MQDGLTELNLNNNFGLFITLNPRTYKMQNGNSSLPAFLKSHFRPVACVEPDRELICAISLYSDGFIQARVSHFNFYLLLIHSFVDSLYYHHLKSNKKMPLTHTFIIFCRPFFGQCIGFKRVWIA